MGNQCCSGSPCESNQVVTTTAVREGQQMLSDSGVGQTKRKFEHSAQDPERISEENEGNPQQSRASNVFAKNQEEHYPGKTTAQEISALPEQDNHGTNYNFPLK